MITPDFNIPFTGSDFYKILKKEEPKQCPCNVQDIKDFINSFDPSKMKEKINDNIIDTDTHNIKCNNLMM